MEISNLNAVSVNGAAHIAEMNHAAANTFLLPAIPPGNSLAECVNFAFSGQFRKYINASTATPPLTTVGNINDYLSSCVCKIYNETFPSLKDIPSYVTKYTPLPPPEQPHYFSVYASAKIPPIFQNISNYYFKVYVPYRTNEPDRRGIGFDIHFGINFFKEFANTLIGLTLDHRYANGTTPATNRLSARVWCSGDQVDGGNADIRVVAFVKDLCIKYFKNMGVKTYINGELV